MNKSSNFNFVVRQSKLINSLLTSFFGLLFLGVLITYLIDSDARLSVYIKALIITFAAFLIGLKNSLHSREILRINNKGLFYYKTLITSWDKFHYASWSDESSAGSIDDKIILYIQFYNQEGVLMEQKLPMSNSQDKSVDQIIVEIQREYNEQLGLIV